MMISKLRASFGKLENETLKLHDGLNVIYAPNESGKSTWCAFIRAMLYGVDSAERARAGRLPDKLRYAPWSGAPMEGTMELRADGSEITLTRRTRAKAAPMRDFSAVYTGTSIPVEGMDGQNAGQLLTGVGREVFNRSAFIAQGAIGVSGNPELEKRINAIVSTGDEETSFSEADATLRSWQRKRRYNRKGYLPELEARMDETRTRLHELQDAGGSIEALEQRLANRQADCRRLEEAMNESRRLQRSRAMDELKRGREFLKSCSERHDADLAELSRRRAALSASVLSTGDLAENERSYLQDEEAIGRLTREGKAEKPLWPALLLFALTISCTALYGLWKNLWLLIPAALCLFGGVALILRFMTARRKAEQARSERQQLLKKYHVRNSEELRELWSAYQALLYAVTEAEEAELNSRELYEQAKQDQLEIENETLSALDFTNGNSEAAQLARHLSEQRAECEQLSSRIAAIGGRLSVLGDPMVLASDLRQMQDTHDELQGEFDAISLAVDTLRQADAELQSRFSPELGRVAAAYMATITDGRYADILIDRDFSARARTDNDSVARESAYLSAGTLDLLYLAVRLAVCELALPEGEPCPLVIDDALVNLDEARSAQAMRLLREIAKKRQVILFTCRKPE